MQRKVVIASHRLNVNIEGGEKGMLHLNSTWRHRRFNHRTFQFLTLNEEKESEVEKPKATKCVGAWAKSQMFRTAST